MGLSDGIAVRDIVIAEMVDCVPETPPDAPTLVTQTPDAPSPVAVAREATLAQTGADPPPRVT